MRHCSRHCCCCALVATGRQSRQYPHHLECNVQTLTCIRPCIWELSAISSNNESSANVRPTLRCNENWRKNTGSTRLCLMAEGPKRHSSKALGDDTISIIAATPAGDQRAYFARPALLCAVKRTSGSLCALVAPPVHPVQRTGVSTASPWVHTNKIEPSTM